MIFVLRKSMDVIRYWLQRLWDVTIPHNFVIKFTDLDNYLMFFVYILVSFEHLFYGLFQVIPVMAEESAGRIAAVATHPGCHLVSLVVYCVGGHYPFVMAN